MKRVNKLMIVLGIAFSCIVFIYLNNNLLTVTNLQVQAENIPESFDGFTIAQISDLHGKTFGENQHILVDKLKASKPDIIVITGDLVDVHHFDKDSIEMLIPQISKIAPVYYILGNHEIRNTSFNALKKILTDNNVVILRNKTMQINRGDEKINICGIDDPIYASVDQNEMNKTTLKKNLEKALANTNRNLFTILLSHRPEQFMLYKDFNIDLTFAGHAHGGQIRLPFTDGLFAPNQGFFPEYTSGKYTSDQSDSTLIVSRGLGNSSFPLRIFDPPEIVVTKLKSNPTN